MAVSIPGGPFTESILAARLVGNTERLACTFLDASTSQGSADERGAAHVVSGADEAAARLTRKPRSGRTRPQSDHTELPAPNSGPSTLPH